MTTRHNLFGTLQTFQPVAGKTALYYSLPQLEQAGIGKISRLPVSVRIVLESVLRNVDGLKITEAHVRELANWTPQGARTDEIPFVVARIVLQDFTGVPLLADLAAMRSAAQALGKDPKRIEPLVPVNLVVDHSVQVDVANTDDALLRNMAIEFQRNGERYQFMKWGMQAFDTFKVVPPGIGIVHQVNLEYLARGVLAKNGVYYPDTLVGTDSHTTMINGIGVVGWGVGGIEAEAGMLGQPVYFLTPDVVGVNLTGTLREGITATDLVLTITEMLRKAKVVGKFVEFFGAGTTALSLPNRATIANMAPEYGATMGFFPVDETTVDYLKTTGRSDEEVSAFCAYFQAQGLFGIPELGEVDYTTVLELDISTIVPSVAGPKRPQDRIELGKLKTTFNELFSKPLTESGYNKPAADLAKRYATQLPLASASCVTVAGGGGQSMESAPSDEPAGEMEMVDNHPAADVHCEKAGEFVQKTVDVGHGDVLIAAITSCTNTSNPGVLLAAGLLAQKAVARGLKVNPRVKTSLAPGSRVVTAYLKAAGLQDALDQLGFKLVGYGCTTCIGNSGPLDPRIEDVVIANDLIAASVLSGNRNFEARVHQNIKANFLMSPPLVVAFAIAGRANIDMSSEPLGHGSDGNPVYLKDIWPTQAEVAAVMHFATDPAIYRKLYADFTRDNPLWDAVPSTAGATYQWDAGSTYIQEPPFFTGFSMTPGTTGSVRGARALALFGDSVTTDHISPAGSIKPSSPAGKYLRANGVAIADFNSYGSRRGNHEVMMRGTFANVRIKNLLIPGSEGGITLHQPDGGQMFIYDAAMRYQLDNVPLAIFAGEEYGTGSSRDWAAKGTQLLGVKFVVARSFERIHRSNLVGMGIVPCQFKSGDSAQTLGLTGTETFDLLGLDGEIKPQQDAALVIHRADGSAREVAVTVRIDTPAEVDYFRHGGILPYVLRRLMA